MIHTVNHFTTPSHSCYVNQTPGTLQVLKLNILVVKYMTLLCMEMNKLFLNKVTEITEF